MLKKDYGNRFEDFFKKTSITYEGKYDSQLREAWDNTKDGEVFEPIKVLKAIKARDPQSQKNIKDLLRHRNMHFVT
jgi:hypothetical protein